MIKVVVLAGSASDPIFEMLARLLSALQVAEVAGVCDDVQHWNQFVGSEFAGIAILDGRLPELSTQKGLAQFLQTHAARAIKFIYLSDSNTPLAPGCHGCIKCDSSAIELASTIVLVSSGNFVFQDGIQMLGSEGNIEYGLSAREEEILRQIALGHTNRQIAERLGITVGTVKNYTSKIFRRLDLKSRTSAAIWARDRYLSSRY